MAVVDITDGAKPKEVFRSTGITSIWRELKVYNNHAYIVTEGGGGVQIVDLSTLPENPNLTVTTFTDNGRISKAHTVWTDDQGFMYLWGVNMPQGKNGYYIYDLKQDPKNPVYYYTGFTPYIHDGFVKGNRMYLSHINAGFFTIWDVSDKKNPIQLGAQETPLQFTHNAWPSADGKYLFTTDEKPNSTLASYDISDPGNIILLDEHRTSPTSKAIVHNTHILNNFAVSSYYTEGFNIVDVSDPENLVEVGKYDCSPYVGETYHGLWEVYPFFASGKIIGSDIEQGLFVFQPKYVRASYLGGHIKNGLNNQALVDAKVSINGTTAFDLSDFSGVFKTGTSEAKSYDLTIEKQGFKTIVMNNVPLGSGITTFLDIKMYPTSTGISSFAEAGIKIGPNPVADVLKISRNEGAPMIESISLLDLSGRTVKQVNVESGTELTIDFPSQAGTYFIQMHLEGGDVVTERLIKN